MTKIRFAEIKDVESLARIHFERTGGSLETLLKRFDWEIRRIKKQEETAGKKEVNFSLLYVAEVDGEVAAYGRLSIQDPTFREEEISPDDKRVDAPKGWYLMGLVVAERFRRRGLGTLLTRKRIEDCFRTEDTIYYFTNSNNSASMELHEKLGFVRIAENIRWPRVEFENGGIGILFRLDRDNYAFNLGD